MLRGIMNAVGKWGELWSGQAWSDGWRSSFSREVWEQYSDGGPLDESSGVRGAGFSNA